VNVEFPLKNGCIISLPKESLQARAKGCIRKELFYDLGVDEGMSFVRFCQILRENEIDGFIHQRRHNKEKEASERTKGERIVKVKCYNAPACKETREVRIWGDIEPPKYKLCHKCKEHGHPSERNGWNINTAPGIVRKNKVKLYSSAEIERIRNEITPLDQCRVAGTMTYPGEASLGGPRANRA